MYLQLLNKAGETQEMMNLFISVCKSKINVPIIDCRLLYVFTSNFLLLIVPRNRLLDIVQPTVVSLQCSPGVLTWYLGQIDPYEIDEIWALHSTIHPAKMTFEIHVIYAEAYLNYSDGKKALNIVSITRAKFGSTITPKEAATILDIERQAEERIEAERKKIEEVIRRLPKISPQIPEQIGKHREHRTRRKTIQSTTNK